MLNHFLVQGRFVKDPELKKTTDNKSVCDFTLAVERDYKKDGKRPVDFFDFTAWESVAELIHKYFLKGDMITLDCKLRTRTYTDKEGKNRRTIDIEVREAHFCGNATKTSDKGNFGNNTAEFEELSTQEDELPF